MKPKISLAGDLGSGKSTVSDLLIADLGAEYYSTGSIVRSIAAKRGMTVTELNVYMETHPEIDHEIDDGLVQLAGVDKFLIIDSRMAWHFTRGTFKVYMSTDIETSALRIMNANRQGEHAATLEETISQTRARRESEKKRYKEQYGVDIKDLSNYDLVIDTTVATPREVADSIAACFEEWKRTPDFKCVLISPERLNYPDDEADAEYVSSLATSLELGLGGIPEVSVFERDGEFYLLEGYETALAHSFNMDRYVPARLVPAPENDTVKYVKMKNSL